MTSIIEQDNIFCDAFIGSEKGLIFGSFWGRNSSLQQFLGRLELPAIEDGITEITLRIEGKFLSTKLQPTSSLDKLSGRVPNTIYGKDLAHIFIYDKSTLKVNHNDHSAVILYRKDIELGDKAIWLLLQEISPIPLLDNPKWADTILSYCRDKGFITKYTGYGIIQALAVRLDVENFEEDISLMIKQKTLTLN